VFQFLNFAALRGKAGVGSSLAKFDKSEGDSIPQDFDPWLTTNSVNVQDGQIHGTSTGNIDEYGAGVYVSPVRSSSLCFEMVLIIFQALNPPIIPPPLMRLPAHPELLYGNHFINPAPLVLPAVSYLSLVSKINATDMQGTKHLKASTRST